MNGCFLKCVTCGGEFYLFSQILCSRTPHTCTFVGLEALVLLVCSDGRRNPGKKFFAQRGA
jgi:hypothetical protein